MGNIPTPSLNLSVIRRTPHCMPRISLITLTHHSSHTHSPLPPTCRLIFLSSLSSPPCIPLSSLVTLHPLFYTSLISPFHQSLCLSRTPLSSLHHYITMTWQMLLSGSSLCHHLHSSHHSITLSCPLSLLILCQGSLLFCTISL